MGMLQDFSEFHNFPIKKSCKMAPYMLRGLSLIGDGGANLHFTPVMEITETTSEFKGMLKYLGEVPP